MMMIMDYHYYHIYTQSVYNQKKKSDQDSSNEQKKKVFFFSFFFGKTTINYRQQIYIWMNKQTNKKNPMIHENGKKTKFSIDTHGNQAKI